MRFGGRRSLVQEVKRCRPQSESGQLFRSVTRVTTCILKFWHGHTDCDCNVGLPQVNIRATRIAGALPRGPSKGLLPTRPLGPHTQPGVLRPTAGPEDLVDKARWDRPGLGPLSRTVVTTVSELETKWGVFPRGGLGVRQDPHMTYCVIFAG